MNGRSLSKNGGRKQQAEGRAQAKAECLESAQQVKTMGGYEVLGGEGHKGTLGGSAEDRLCRVSHTRHGH